MCLTGDWCATLLTLIYSMIPSTQILLPDPITDGMSYNIIYHKYVSSLQMRHRQEYEKIQHIQQICDNSQEGCKQQLIRGDEVLHVYILEICPLQMTND